MKINKIYRPFFYLTLFIVFTVNSYGQEVLNQYLETAAYNNSGLKARFNEYLAALERVPQVGVLPDPVIAFGYFIQPVETRLGPQQARISASQMFPWFGTLSMAEKSAVSDAKVYFGQFEEAKSKLYYNVKSTYYNLYFTNKAIEIANENITILESFKNLAQIRIESGSAPAIDAYRVEMEINDLENQLALLKDYVKVLAVSFNNFLNVDDNANIQSADSLVGLHLNDKAQELDSILVNNNVLASFDFQIEGLDNKEKLAKKEGMPKFSLGIDYTFIGDGNGTVENSGQDAIMFPKVGIVVPLYRKKYKAKVKEILYLQEAKTNRKDNEKNTLTILFESTWKDYQDAQRRIELYRKQTELAKISLSILESDYSTGKASFEELLRMESKLLKYALELQKAKADKEASVAFIYYLQGK